MARTLVWAALWLAATVVQAPAQPSPGDVVASLAGQWTYRSFHNNPAPVGDDPQKVLDLIFAEATFIFDPPSGNTIKGMIDWGSGGLDLSGTVQSTGPDGPVIVYLVGTGRPNSQTAGWQYDYHAHVTHRWPNGVNQVTALTGSVIRAKPHGSAAAGYVASFIAVKRP